MKPKQVKLGTKIHHAIYRAFPIEPQATIAKQNVMEVISKEMVEMIRGMKLTSTPGVTDYVDGTNDTIDDIIKKLEEHE